MMGVAYTESHTGQFGILKSAHLEVDLSCFDIASK